MDYVTKKPKIGLALSGASSRSIFYIGFLEVLQEQSIPIDYIAACSGGSIVAACYSCGTLDNLKETAMRLTRESVFTLLERSPRKGGVYSLDKVEAVLRTYTKNLQFEDVRPHMGFVAADLDKGEQVVISMGDIARAARVACTLPGIFEPVQWGSRTLVDGGLLNVLPMDVLKQVGMDVCIGIDLQGTPHIFNKKELVTLQTVRLLRKIFFINQAKRLWEHFIRVLGRFEFFEEFFALDDSVEESRFGTFSVLGRAMDLAIQASKQDYRRNTLAATDLIITPAVPKRGYTDFSQSQDLYQLGRSTAIAALPKIRTVIYEAEQLKTPAVAAVVGS
jgi:NTE family protein